MFKDQQLYLYGPPDVGKSTFIRTLLKDYSSGIIYPSCGEFFLDGFHPNNHRVVLFEEFDEKRYPLSVLNVLLEGGVVSINRKGLRPISVSVRGVVCILISNLCFDRLSKSYEQDDTPALEERSLEARRAYRRFQKIRRLAKKAKKRKVSCS